MFWYSLKNPATWSLKYHGWYSLSTCMMKGQKDQLGEKPVYHPMNWRSQLFELWVFLQMAPHQKTLWGCFLPLLLASLENRFHCQTAFPVKNIILFSYGWRALFVYGSPKSEESDSIFQSLKVYIFVSYIYLMKSALPHKSLCQFVSQKKCYQTPYDFWLTFNW